MTLFSSIVRWTALTGEVAPGICVYRGYAPTYEHEILQARYGERLVAAPWCKVSDDDQTPCRVYVLEDAGLVDVQEVHESTARVSRLEFMSLVQSDRAGAWCREAPVRRIGSGSPTAEFVLAVGLSPELRDEFFELLREKDLPWRQLQSVLRDIVAAHAVSRN